MFFLSFLLALTSAFFLSLLPFFLFLGWPRAPFVHHPMSEEVSATIGTPIEGFFDGAAIVAEAMASASTATQGAPAEALIPSPKLGPV